MGRKIYLWLLALIMTTVLAGCSNTAEKAGTLSGLQEPIKVLVSILPQADFVQQVGGDRVQVTVLIPPGANPEEYEMSPRQIQRISEADLYFAVGDIPFEAINFERIKSANPSMAVINAPGTTDKAAGGHHDPHVWLSPKSALAQVETIYEALGGIDADNKEVFLNNKNSYAAQLESLDGQIRELLSDRKRDYFLVYHPAWSCFAQEYGLTELAIEKEGKEPTAFEMRNIITTAREKGVKSVLATPQHSTRSAEAVAKQLEGQVKIVDPLPEDYIQGMLETAAVFKEVLNEGD